MTFTQLFKESYPGLTVEEAYREYLSALEGEIARRVARSEYGIVDTLHKEREELIGWFEGLKAEVR